MGSCRYCRAKMTYEELQAHLCTGKVEGELFAQRFPARELAAKAAFAQSWERAFRNEGGAP